MDVISVKSLHIISCSISSCDPSDSKHCPKTLLHCTNIHKVDLKRVESSFANFSKTKNLHNFSSPLLISYKWIHHKHFRVKVNL